MIASLKGTVTAKDLGTITIDVHDVGYEVTPTLPAYSETKVGDKATFHIAEDIKEDSFTLYGFKTAEERNMYYQLTSVTGVGPKAAMAILSKHPVEEIEKAIVAGTIALFSNVSGIGKKTAGRIILELKGRLVAEPEKAQVINDPAYQALITLGYSAKQAGEAVKDLPTELSLNERVKRALQELAK